ncbi:uncharacterized protein BJ171DRAFT_497185 [Polychytrium aggregatum]|uniref:uncharacterized protein n=1 Tax=Polychytrium aggregatum TaxID=110093 RepID=UPI0022FDB47D|nr:uncharacterized protein BJ171DRAFT_497185 [Polychytrium aggregatum]KAI9206291.1 hypothetical protein BJ171DRAFT_497185 [Polychytrium aggregatum]
MFPRLLVLLLSCLGLASVALAQQQPIQNISVGNPSCFSALAELKQSNSNCLGSFAASAIPIIQTAPASQPPLSTLDSFGLSFSECICKTWTPSLTSAFIYQQCTNQSAVDPNSIYNPSMVKVISESCLANSYEKIPQYMSLSVVLQSGITYTPLTSTSGGLSATAVSLAVSLSAVALSVLCLLA